MMCVDAHGCPRGDYARKTRPTVDVPGSYSDHRPRSIDEAVRPTGCTEL